MAACAARWLSRSDPRRVPMTSMAALVMEVMSVPIPTSKVPSALAFTLAYLSDSPTLSALVTRVRSSRN